MKDDVSFRATIFGVIAGFGLLLAPLGVAAAGESADDQPASLPGTQLVDANGTIVGTLISPDIIERKVHGLWVNINNSANGFDNNFGDGAGGIGFYFTSSNCTGLNYMDATETPANGYLGSTATTAQFVSTGTLYFPGTPRAALTINSTVVLTSAGFAPCNNSFSPFSLFVGPTDKIELNFVAPFSVQ